MNTLDYNVSGLVHDVDHSIDPLAVHGQTQRFLSVKERKTLIAVKRQFVSRLNPCAATSKTEDTMNKDRLYIAYGSNLNLEQMKHRCPTSSWTFR